MRNRKNILIVLLLVMPLVLAACSQKPKQEGIEGLNLNVTVPASTNTNTQPANVNRGTNDTNDNLDDALKDLDAVE